MYFQRKSKVKQNRPSFCNYHLGSYATAPQIRLTPAKYILNLLANLLAVGMENLLCNGKGAPYLGRVEFERGLWRSAWSLRGKWRSLAIPGSRGWSREGSPKSCPLTVPVRSRLQPGSLRPPAERFFWRVNSRIQPRRPFVGWVR